MTDNRRQHFPNYRGRFYELPYTFICTYELWILKRECDHLHPTNLEWHAICSFRFTVTKFKIPFSSISVKPFNWRKASRKRSVLCRSISWLPKTTLIVLSFGNISRNFWRTLGDSRNPNESNCASNIKGVNFSQHSSRVLGEGKAYSIFHMTDTSEDNSSPCIQWLNIKYVIRRLVQRESWDGSKNGGIFSVEIHIVIL